MKKFLSILLAALMVCSMGIFAFAAEEEAVEEPAAADVAAAAEKEEAPAEEAKTTAAGDLSSLEKKIASKGLDSSDMKSLLSSALSSIGKNIKDFTPEKLLSLPANVMDDVVTYIFAGLKALGVDVDALYEKLSSNKIINWFVNTFYKGTCLTTTAPAPADEPSNIPQTGSAASIAVFATLSLAAGAAFVSFKKKEA